jgi:hypothetical protein
MTQQNITIGTADAKEGDTLYSAFTKTEGNFTDLYTDVGVLQTDVTTLDTRLKVVEGDAPAAVPGGMFVSDGAGGGEFIRVQGWEQYEDTAQAVGTPSQTIATGVRTLWTNDGGTLALQKPPSDAVSPLWNTTTNKIIPIAAFDTYNVRIGFKVQDYAGTTPDLKIEIDIGGTIGVIASRTVPLLKGGAEQSMLLVLPVFAGSTFLTNGGEIYLTFTGTGSCKIFNSSIMIIRESKNYV